jgi:cell division protease FtsH
MKYLHEKALKDPIQFKQGFAHRKGNLLMDGAQAILNMTLLFFVLIIAQSIAADVLVGKNFNLTSHDLDISFDDIIGYDEVKREFSEVIDQLKNAKAFATKGVTAPRGILLTGSPGVGKTMFAKALANEAKAKFLYATGSDFVELYVGTGARRARAMFKQARLEGPTVIFIDEIDALGSRDAWGMDSERQSTINQILSEMDGMSSAGEILVVGATNHPGKLDPALLRPGRFDKKIAIPNPDAPTREGILMKHLRESGYAPDIDVRTFALRCSGCSGADLKNLVAEAKNLALRETKGQSASVSQKHLDLAQEIVLLGTMEREPNAKERERVAYHELGHALAAHELCPHLEVSKVAVGARGAALGFTMQIPIEERSLHTQAEMLAQICALLAGRAAEEAYLGNISNGSSDDLEKASGIALKMASQFGMGATSGLLSTKPSPANGEWSESVLNDAKTILDSQYAIALETVKARDGWMREKAALLLERGSLDRQELFDLSTTPRQ